MSKNILARLLEYPGIWRGRSLTRIETRSSGFPELDARLAGGGWPKVGLVEILATHLGSGELRLLLPLLAAVTHQPQARWCTWIAPPLTPYAPALAAHGVNLARILVVRRQGPRGPGMGPRMGHRAGADFRGLRCGTHLDYPAVETPHRAAPAAGHAARTHAGLPAATLECARRAGTFPCAAALGY